MSSPIFLQWQQAEADARQAAERLRRALAGADTCPSDLCFEQLRIARARALALLNLLIGEYARETAHCLGRRGDREPRPRSVR